MSAFNLPEAKTLDAKHNRRDRVAGQTSRLEDARLIFTDAVRECSVEKVFASKIGMAAGSRVLRLGDAGEIDLDGVKRILVLAVGKAAGGMLEVFLRGCVPEGCVVQGVLIAPAAPAELPAGIAHFAGGHPLPNRASFEGASAALAMLRGAAGEDAEKTFCFFLVSGGASAMMDLPLDGGIALEDTREFHRALVGSGASITEINCVRKHFSAVKGGRLGMAAGGLRSVTLLVSDVPAGKLDAISSGPTLADSTTVGECRSVMERCGLAANFPPAVRRFFESDLLVETPKAGELDGRAYVVLSSDDLAEAARRCAESLGYAVVVDQSCDDWDYRLAADYLLGRIRTLRRAHGRVCLISAGEVTVEVSGEAQGVGGRNLHFALYCATQLEESERVAVLSAGSDGVDGNSSAAGAVVDAGTVASCRGEAERALREFASFDLLDGLGAAVFTGPTGNNLRDLRVLLAEE